MDFNRPYVYLAVSRSEHVERGLREREQNGERKSGEHPLFAVQFCVLRNAPHASSFETISCTVDTPKCKDHLSTLGLFSVRDWKQAERRIAAILGGRRIPVSGRGRGDNPDIERPSLSVEVKARAGG